MPLYPINTGDYAEYYIYRLLKNIMELYLTNRSILRKINVLYQTLKHNENFFN